MESGRTLSVKAILLKEGSEEGAKEIRRFQMEVEGDPRSCRRGERVENLLSHVHSVFSVDSGTQHCSLFWKDGDGDLILCSRDDELHCALDSMVDDTLRIYVIVNHGRTANDDDPSAPLPDDVGAQASGSSSRPAGASSSGFQGPPHPHPHCPPPPFHGPWARGGGCGKHAGRGGWRGGWKGGLYFGCPWNMGRGMYGGCGKGWKGKGMFKHGGCGQMKMKKMMKTMGGFQTAFGNNWDNAAEFREVRLQVPAEFRRWVRQYVHTWHTQGPDAAQQAGTTNKLPEGMGQDFPTWLHAFLSRHHAPKPSTSEEAMDTGKDEEGETEKAPDCIPAVYYRWLCLFLPRFFHRNGRHAKNNDNNTAGAAGTDSEGAEASQSYPGCHGYGYMYGPGFFPCKRFARFYKHACGGKKKGGKHGRCSSSSESSDSETDGKKEAHTIPKGFRKFVRKSFKQLEKGKQSDIGSLNPKLQAKAARAGLSTEVQEFVQQTMVEWRAKLPRHQHPRALATEMLAAERTLPAGLHQDLFQWMVRFMARCSSGGRRCGGGAGKSGGAPMPGSSDDSSEGEGEACAAPQGGQHGCGRSRRCCRFPPFHPPPPAPMMGGDMPYPPFMGMMGHPPPPYAPFAMGPFGCFPPAPHGHPFGCPPHQPGNDDSSAEKTSSSDDGVDRATEGVKKL